MENSRPKMKLRSFLLSSVLLLSLLFAGTASAAMLGGDSGSSNLSEECGSVSEGLGGAIGCQTSDKVVDFTEYSGQFEGPDSAGYDSALTQTRDAREFIQTVVNFALSFLGLAAVVMVIYGGILYVLSRGDEEMVGKGKKTMGYAVMGIFIILGSFALVNTLIGATGGGNQGTVGGGGLSDATIAEAGASFDTDALLNELESILEEYIQSYQRFDEVQQEWQYMMSVDVPFYLENVDVNDNTLGGWIENGTDWLFGDSDGDQQRFNVYDHALNNYYMSEIQAAVEDIQADVDPFSRTYESSQELVDFLRAGREQGLKSLEVFNFIPIVIPSAHAANSDINLDGFIQALLDDGQNGAEACKNRIDQHGNYTERDIQKNASGKTGGAFGNSTFGSTSYDANVVTLPGVKKVCLDIYSIGQDNILDYLNEVQALKFRAQEIQSIFDTGETAGLEGSSLEEINDYADEVLGIFQDELLKFGVVVTPNSRGNEIETFNGIDDVYTSANQINAGTSRQLLSKLDQLYTAVENLQFVAVSLRASTSSGNAPLIVTFDALGTLDPTGNTVSDQQIIWDLDGNGTFNTESNFGAGVTGDQDPGPSNTVIYKKAGTYRARVKVISSDPNVAPGLAIVNVVVEPPKSRLSLLASTPNTQEVKLAGFVNTATPFGGPGPGGTNPGGPSVPSSGVEIPVDQDFYRVTLSEAEQGITFDASASTDKDKNESGIVFFEWDFGDGTSDSGARAQAATVTHQYGEQGTYDASLTISDVTGVKDRKYFKVYVGSPAARISCFPDAGAVGDVFTCDGSESTTDVGTIVGYSWVMTGESSDGSIETIALENSTGIQMEHAFEKPGVYNVSLTVVDSTSGDTEGSDGRDTATTDLLVESQTPVPQFSYESTDPKKPGIRVLNASDSFDPDEADTLSYEWEISGTRGTDFSILKGDLTSEELTVQFLTKGDYEITLTATDDHGVELQKSASITQTVPVPSVIDIDMTVEPENARHLDANGEAEVQFNVFSETATFIEMDYDDGITDATQDLARGQATFTHVFDAAGVYNVKATVADDDGDQNTFIVRIYIAVGDAPIAVVDVDGNGEDLGSGEAFVGNVNTTFTFDASNSMNRDGEKTGLKYSWNFGDGSTASQPKVTHTFDEINTYTVTLTVRDKNDNSIFGESTVLVRIEGLSPEVKGMTVIPQGNSLETPLNVNVSVDAKDEDGRISFYKGWYYDLRNSAEELGTVIAQQPNFSITVNTNGMEGDEKEYGFAVEVTDNDNNSTVLMEAMQPTLTVVNGPNENPVAQFQVDRTSIYLGESLIITNTSFDPDGQIEEFIIDTEGNGFFDNEPYEGNSFEWVPEQVFPDGTEIQVKVRDSAGATATSEKVRVFVDAVTDAPEAAFLTTIDGKAVDFQNNSKIDPEVEIQGLFWDIDLDNDSDGDGDPSNDIDYLKEDFVHNYDKLGTYQVRMTIFDTTGQSDYVTQDINVIETIDPEADFSYSIETEGGTVVKFKNNSFVDEANGVTVRSYTWDFDLSEDTTGIDDPENNNDSTGRSPKHDYGDFGEYEVKLSIVDSYGKTSESIQSIVVPDPIEPVRVNFTAAPQPNAAGQVVLTGDEADVSFYFNAEGGSGKYSYEFDKNIFYDTNGDGIRENDVDHDTLTAGTWQTKFYKSYGTIVVKVTATDLETGDTDVDTLQVVFQASLGSVNLFNATPSELVLLILSSILAAIIGLSLIFRSQLRPSTRRLRR